jgi:hypothetical protein
MAILIGEGINKRLGVTCPADADMFACLGGELTRRNMTYVTCRRREREKRERKMNV